MANLKLFQLVNYTDMARSSTLLQRWPEIKNNRKTLEDKLHVRFGDSFTDSKGHNSLFSQKVSTSKGDMALGKILLHMVYRRSECDNTEGDNGQPPEEVQSDEYYQSKYYVILSMLGILGDDKKHEILEKLKQAGLILPEKNYNPYDPQSNYFTKASLAPDAEKLVYEWACSQKNSSFFSDSEKSMLAALLPSKKNVFRSKIEYDFKQRLKNTESILQQRIVGQKDIIIHVAKWLRKHYISEIAPVSPLNFIFVGPTGVGKTETAKAIQELLTGNENDFVRFDMNTFQDKHHGDKFGGAPPGYVGHEEGGQITRPFIEEPSKKRVILLDEIEKGYHSIYQQLLQLLGEGRFADSQGKVVDAKNAVIIMTSNLFTKESKENIDKGPFGFFSYKNNDATTKEQQSYYDTRQAVRRFFSPEFINRVNGGILVFKNLTNEDRLEIFDRKLNKIIETYQASGRKIKLKLENKHKILNFLINKTNENLETAKNHNGARLVEHVMNSYLALPLNEFILGINKEKWGSQKEIAKGSTIKVFINGDSLDFKCIKP